VLLSDVLLIDGNPDHVRPLSGLFKYRVKHDLEVVGDCVSGLRRVYANPPDVILINALLFASEEYGFPRALAEEDAHAGIRVIVLVSGSLDEIRERSVAQYGAVVLELPTSAGEISEAIEKAPALRRKSAEPQAVSWATASPTKKKAAPEDQPVVQRVAWQPLKEEPKTDEGVRTVNWSVDGGKGQKAPTRKVKPARPTAPPPAEDTEPRVIKGGGDSFRPAFTSSSDGFRPMSEAAEKLENVEEESGPQPFKASNFKGLKDVDPKQVKNR
jgi:hypothetical protein